jgi:hypothetical protein
MGLRTSGFQSLLTNNAQAFSQILESPANEYHPHTQHQ